MCLACLILAITGYVAPKLAADLRRRMLQLRIDLDSRKSAAMEMLNLVAFVLARLSVAQVLFDLAMKLYRLPRLSRYTVGRVVRFRIEFNIAMGA